VSAITSIQNKLLVQQLRGALMLVRAWNLILLGALQYIIVIGIRYGIDRVPSAFLSLRLFYITLVTTLTGAAVYSINDYFDAKVDTVNAPARVVVGRLVHRRGAILLNLVFAITALTLASLYNVRLLLAALIGILAMVVYSSTVRRNPIIAPLLIAALLAGATYLPFWVEDVYSGDAIIFSLYGFFMILIRQLIKDLRDLRGDMRFGVPSLPIVFGVRRAKVVLAVLFALYCLSFYSCSYWLRPGTGLYFLFLLPFLTALVFYTIRADTQQRYRKALLLCKIFLVLGALGALVP
jgi:4-hydroxybenzoate polyprenyltransferase